MVGDRSQTLASSSKRVTFSNPTVLSYCLSQTQVRKMAIRGYYRMPRALAADSRYLKVNKIFTRSTHHAAAQTK